MKRNALYTLLVVSMVFLAGCSGGVPGASDASPTDTAETDALSQSAGDGGTVAFYLSDEENDIGDFQSLNVTITSVGFERSAADGGGWIERDVDNRTADLTELQGANATLIDEYDLPNGNYSKVFVHVGDVNGTLQSGENVRVKLPSEKLQLTKGFTISNDSQVEFVFDITVHKAGNSGKYILKPVVSESGTDVAIESVDDRDELSVDVLGNVTRGENATVEVTRDGEPVENATVTVNDESVGTTDADGRLTVSIPADDEVEIEVEKGDAEGELEVEFEEDEMDEDEQDEMDEDEQDDEMDEDDAAEDEQEDADEEAAELNATFIGNVTQGENVTLEVTRDGEPVENATVVVNGELVGTTDADGQSAFTVPDEDSLTVTVQDGDSEAELERDFESDDSS